MPQYYNFSNPNASVMRDMSLASRNIVGRDMLKKLLCIPIFRQCAEKLNPCALRRDHIVGSTERWVRGVDSRMLPLMSFRVALEKGNRRRRVANSCSKDERVMEIVVRRLDLPRGSNPTMANCSPKTVPKAAPGSAITSTPLEPGPPGLNKTGPRYSDVGDVEGYSATPL
jgi:hypothetical protein